MNATKWVLTIHTEDDVTVHVEDHDKAALDRNIAVLRETFGPTFDADHALIEVPATWECDGRDGCTTAA